MTRDLLSWMVLSWGLAVSGAAVAAESVHPPESVLMIAGQSREEFRDYLQQVCRDGEACPLPAGATFYTSLSLTGFESPHANVPGDHHQDMWYLANVYSPLVIQIGLWLSRDQLEPIAQGRYESEIETLARYLAELERPVFLRIGYEFDGPHNRYPPEAYVRAYREIAGKMRTNRDVLLVWHSFAMYPTYQDIDPLEWYPGDDVVDWLGMSYFQVGSEGYHTKPNRERILSLARDRNKPVLIAEASAIRYTKRQKTLNGKRYWDYWYRPFFEFIEQNPVIKAVSMINVNWDSQAQHRQLDWGDSRIHADEAVLRHWRNKAQAEYWRNSGPRLYEYVRILSGLKN